MVEYRDRVPAVGLKVQLGSPLAECANTRSERRATFLIRVMAVIGEDA